MLYKSALFVVGMSAALLLVAPTASEEQEQDVEKRGKGPTTLNDVIKILMNIQKRFEKSVKKS